MMSFIFNPAENGSIMELRNSNEKILSFASQTTLLRMDKNKSILPQFYLDRDILTEAFKLRFLRKSHMTHTYTKWECPGR